MKPVITKSGFSLAEMLTAVAITLVIGTAAFSIMFAASKIWREGVSSSSEISEFDFFDTDFARDFNSSCASCGFSGNETNCTFATFRLVNGGPPTLEKVSYSIANGAVFSSKGRIYRTSAIKAFSFDISTNSPSGTFSAEFTSTNSSPALINASIRIPHTTLDRRLYMRAAE